MAPAAIAFYLFASLALVSGVMVVTRRNAVHAALFLVLTFFSVAGIYIVLSAEFLAAVQVLVYAGGVLVLYLFVIMLVPLRDEKGLQPAAKHIAVSMVLSSALAAVLISYFWNAEVSPTTAVSGGLAASGGNIEAVGMELYTRYLLPFEIASVLLLVAMIGAVVLARKEV
ncbi:MAG TPA: NADH-quinone oxidoreductase subunit J [Candidatus Polarisedimenticolia bacterium]|nr:NADH-quinone oxidoreductase subunit J [Candidatus Polarisedimenticolia bacterium]